MELQESDLGVQMCCLMSTQLFALFVLLFLAVFPTKNIANIATY